MINDILLQMAAIFFSIEQEIGQVYNKIDFICMSFPVLTITHGRGFCRVFSIVVMYYLHNVKYNKTNTLLQIFGFVAFIEQKENDNNDNLCKIHGGLYIALALSILLHYHFPIDDSSESFENNIYMYM